MTAKSGLSRRARQFSVEDRIAKLMSFQEEDFHKSLGKLFSEIDKDALVTITHSSKEFGADLVVVRKDAIRESIASVVVSMGHLRGETGKQIERITSQIKQCIDIPREISTRVEIAQTTEVWLVIVGKTTGNARSRLRYQVKKEYKAVLTILDIEWLVKKFTDCYPEIFLGGEVLDFIEERLDKLELTTSLSKRAEQLNLSEWYVEPYLSTGGIPIDIDEAGNKITIRSHRVQFRKLRSILEREERIIVSGEAGVGKTTALSKLVLDMLREVSDVVVGGRDKGMIKIPVIMPAREILDCDSCESFIKKCVEKRQLMEGFEISILILDGLDEVSKEYRGQVLEKATDFCSEMKWNVIIGSRKIDIIKNPPKGLNTFELLPFEISQAMNLFEKIVKKGKLLDTLKEGLSKVMNQLPMTPISLTILIEIAEEHGEVPASLADLYNRYFEMVLGKWDFRDKGVESLFQYETKLHFLTEIAWVKFTNKDNVEITKTEFDDFVKWYIEIFGFETSWINRFIAEIERAGLIEIKDMVSFKHRSFLDYFAALYLFNHQDEFDSTEELVAKLYFSDLWSDVTFYFIGIRRAMSEKILDKIMNYKGEDFSTRISKYVIGRLLQAGWLTPIEIKYFGIKSALSHLMPIRDKLAESFSKTRPSPGLIFADFLPIVTAEWTMGSITLLGVLQRLDGELIESKSKERFWERIAITWASWKFLTNEVREKLVSEILTDLSNEQQLTAEEKSTILLLMVALEDKNKSIRNAIKRRLNRLAKQHPAIFTKLLPPPIDGFRKKRTRK